MTRLSAETVAPIRSGVFFTLPEPLPRGRHGLSRDEVRAAQRERILAAATELLGAVGYRGFGVGDVARRAGVSLAVFYDCFADKDACVFAGYDRFIEVTLGRLTAIDLTGADRTRITQALLYAYLGALQDDLVVARAYQVEIDSLGPAARDRRRTSLRLFAAYIREVVARTTADTAAPDDVAESAYIGVVYAARQLASDALDAELSPDLTALGDDLAAWVADVFRAR